MNIPENISKLHAEMRTWRRHLHSHPELAYEEQLTAHFISRKLESFGYTPQGGIAGTGVVASLRCGSSAKSIALRADMDALAIEEANELEYCSKINGKMHACGHDGHSAMLLGAAKILKDSGNFDGTVHFIFQPAEEGRAGAKRMLEEGLFERFPCDMVFGMHNFPHVPTGHFAVKSGPLMAALSCFEIHLSGIGSHAAKPHQGQDVIVMAALLVQSLQTIVSRNVDPMQQAVVSITQIHSGETWNVIPEHAVIRGTFRYFDSQVGKLDRKSVV